MVSLKSKALYYLSKREYAYRELFEKLKLYCDDVAQIRVALDSLVATKYLSDERYIWSYLNCKSRKYGLHKIRHNLIQKTGDSDLVDNLLNEFRASIDERNIAYELWKKKFGGEKATDRKGLAKQIRYLQAKGFSSTIIGKVLDL